MGRSLAPRSFGLLAALLACAAVFAGSSAAAGLLGGVNMVGGGPDDANFQLAFPTQIERVPDGTFFVIDSSNHRIVHLSATGTYLGAFGGPSPTDSGTANAVSIVQLPGSADPDLLVANGTGVIKRFTSGGVFVSKFSLPMSTAAYLAIDPSWGDLYVSETNANQVQRIALGDSPCTPGTTEQPGAVLDTFGVGSGLISDFLVAGKLWGPRGLAFDSTGRLYVADRNQRRVSVFKHTGQCAAWTYEDKFGSNSSGSPELMLASEGVAIDRSVVPNKIYVTNNYLENVVLSYTGGAGGDPPFTFHGRWGSIVPYGTEPGSGPDDLNYPNGIVVSGANAWVVESGNGRIHKYAGVSAETPFTTPVSAGTWGHPPREDGYFESSGNLAAAPDGSLFALDRQKKRVQHFSPRGTFLGAWGADGPGAGQFNFNPNGIAVNSSGEVLISGAVAGIQRFDESGSYLGTITWTPLSAPDPIAPGPLRLDAAGHIWTWDYSGQKVLKLDTDGTILASFGTSGFSAGDSISNAADLAVSADGLTVYVLDQPTNLVKKFTSTNGTDYTFALASQPDTGAGTGDGLFSGPSSIAIDPNTGQVAVADSGNNRVQRLSGSDLSFVSKFGSYGFGDNELIDPFGLAFDQWGNLWLGDHGSDRIKRIGDAPVVTLGSAPATTTAASVVISYTQTDPGADCDIASGATVPLSIGSNTIVVTCTNAQGPGTDSVTIERGTAPVLTLTAPLDGSSTTATSTPVTWTTTGTGPIACELNGVAATSPSTLNLNLGPNLATVYCTSDYGSDTRAATVTRTAPVIAPLPNPPGAGAVSLKLPKKFKISKKKLKFSVTCPDGCTVRSRLFFGTEGGRVQNVRRAASAAPQTVTLKFSRSQIKKVTAALTKKQTVYLSVTVQSYKATQGKTGKASVAK